MSSEEMPGLDRPYNHRLQLCNLGEDKDGFPYRVLTRLVSFDAYSEYIEVEGLQKRVFRPEVEHVECTVTDGESVWYAMLYAELYNVSRRRAGGRDDTWEKEEFDLIILDALQNPYENPGMSYHFKVNDDGNLALEIKDTKPSGKVVSLLKNCVLKKTTEKSVQETVEYIEGVLTDHLSIACRIGDLDHAQHIRELGGDPHRGSNDETSWTPLQLASRYGHLDIVKWLVDELDVNVNHKSPDDMTAIRCAVERGFNDIVQFLAKRGAEINIPKLEIPTSIEEDFRDLGLKHGHKDVIVTFVGDDGLYIKKRAARSKEELKSMFQLGPYDTKFYGDYDETRGRTDVRFPPGHDRKSYVSETELAMRAYNA